MTRGTGDFPGRLAGPIYLVAFVLWLQPMVDFFANVWPLSVGMLPWRYGAVGISAGFVLTPLLAVVIAMTTAALMGHHRVMKTLAVLCGIGALLLFVASVGFVFDVLELRVNVNEEGMSQYVIGAWKAEFKLLTTVAVLVWMTIAGWKEGVAATAPKRKDSTTPLVRSPGAVDG